MEAPATIDLRLTVSESARIINAHSRHFLSLSVLFLLPLSSLLLLLLSTFRYSPKTDSTSKTLLQFDTNFDKIRIAPFDLLYAVSLLLLSLSAAATVTDSVRHGFFGRPVNFVPALRSLPPSLGRLAITLACGVSVLAALAVVCAVVAYLVFRAVSFLGFQIPAASPSVVLFIGAVFLVCLSIFLLSRFAICPVVVVVESSWGLEPLRRSEYLLSGCRGAAVAFGLIFAGDIAGLVFVFSFAPGLIGEIAIIAGTICGLTVMIVLALYGLAVNTVLYMYCKAVRGELAGEIAAEFNREYVTLPFDEQKVPHFVSVVRS